MQPMPRTAGKLLVALGIAQAALYTVAGRGGEPVGRLFYFDPRIGWFFLESLMRRDETFPGVTSWATAGVALTLGIALLRGRVGGRAYVAAEAVMALPTLCMFLCIGVRHMSPAHGFSAGELLIPVLVFIVVSAGPLGWALWRGLANQRLHPTATDVRMRVRGRG